MNFTTHTITNGSIRIVIGHHAQTHTGKTIWYATMFKRNILGWKPFIRFPQTVSGYCIGLNQVEHQQFQAWLGRYGGSQLEKETVEYLQSINQQPS